MGRKRRIDRDAILDAAEAIVGEEGAARLTFDAVAERAGVSKGGVLYCFPSKPALIAAMTERDLARFEAEVDRRAGTSAGGGEGPYAIAAHVEATHAESRMMAARSASLMAAMMDANDADLLRAYYRERLDRIDTSTEAGRQARLAFLACEGAFLLRGLGLADVPGTEWDEIFGDIRGLIGAGA